MNNKLIIAYAVAGLLTFGYSYNAHHRVITSPYTSTEEVNTIGAIIAGLCWPFYWSVQAFQWARK